MNVAVVAMGKWLLLVLVMSWVFAAYAKVSTRKAPPTPVFLTVGSKQEAMMLYDKDGNKVAACTTNGEQLKGCKVETGYTFDDVMNAWLHAYEEKPE